jgi:hypothetical protein
MNCTMNCSVNWHLTYRDADVSTYSDGHGAYMSIMHDKKTPPNAVEKIGGGFNGNTTDRSTPNYNAPNRNRKTTPRVQQTYRGIKRAYRERL